MNGAVELRVRTAAGTPGREELPAIADPAARIGA
jgi:hypothetical protein